MTIQAPAISVVLGVRNGEDRLEESLESVLRQTEQCFELIVVDDGSEDRTPEILRHYNEADSRVRCLSQPAGGLTKALIRGCQLARGALVARLDVGDTCDPQRLQRQKEAFEADASLAFVSCWTHFVGPGGESLWVEKGTGRASEAIQILGSTAPRGVVDGPTCHPSVMFRRSAYEAVGGYREEFRLGQDWDLWYRLAEQGTFLTVPAVLVEVTIEPSSVSRTKAGLQQRFAQLALDGSRLRQAGISDSTVLKKASQHSRWAERAGVGSRHEGGYYFLGEAMRRNGDRRCLNYFMNEVRLRPLQIRAWVRLIQSIGLRGAQGSRVT